MDLQKPGARILALSKRVFDREMEKYGIEDSTVESFEGMYFISINSSLILLDDEERVKFAPWFKENHRNVLNLRFDDVLFPVEAEMVGVTPDGKPMKYTRSAVPMDESQAKELAAFIKSIPNGDNTKIIVHCAAGVSRSGATATCIAEYFHADMKEFAEMNPQINPNKLVLKLLRNELYR